jgi:hypothetical protein
MIQDWNWLGASSINTALIYTKPPLSQGSRPAASFGNQGDFGYRALDKKPSWGCFVTARLRSHPYNLMQVMLTQGKMKHALPYPASPSLSDVLILPF